MRMPAQALLVDVTAAAGEDGLDPALRALVDEVRAAGRPVVVGSRTGVGDGVRKPSREYFAAVCAALGVPPDRCLFVDDEDRNVRAARVVGLAAFRWTGPGDLPYLRAALAL